MSKQNKKKTKEDYLNEAALHVDEFDKLFGELTLCHDAIDSIAANIDKWVREYPKCFPPGPSGCLAANYFCGYLESISTQFNKHITEIYRNMMEADHIETGAVVDE